MLGVHIVYAGANPEIFKRGEALYAGHRGWPVMNILGFRWSKKTEETLETISFWRNISISISDFLQFYQ